MSASTRADGRRVGTGSVARSATASSARRAPGPAPRTAAGGRGGATGRGTADPRRAAPRRRRRRPGQRRRGRTTRTAAGRPPSPTSTCEASRRPCTMPASCRSASVEATDAATPPTSATEPVQRVTGSPAYAVRSSHDGSPRAGSGGDGRLEVAARRPGRPPPGGTRRPAGRPRGAAGRRRGRRSAVLTATRVSPSRSTVTCTFMERTMLTTSESCQEGNQECGSLQLTGSRRSQWPSPAPCGRRGRRARRPAKM